MLIHRYPLNRNCFRFCGYLWISVSKQIRGWARHVRVFSSRDEFLVYSRVLATLELLMLRCGWLSIPKFKHCCCIPLTAVCSILLHFLFFSFIRLYCVYDVIIMMMMMTIIIIIIIIGRVSKYIIFIPDLLLLLGRVAQLVERRSLAGVFSLSLDLQLAEE